MKEKKWKLYGWLFTVNIFISAFTFGGGYVVVPMIRKYFVVKKRLFSEDELMDMAAVAQSTPGAIAINLAALAGYRTAGTIGTVISCIAAVLPPLVILGVISLWYAAFAANTVIAAVLRGMQAGVAALIVDLVADMCQMIWKEKSVMLTLMVPAAFVASFFMKINVAQILIVCCILCIIRTAYQRGGKKCQN
ncbi:MAG: chromate transporter [Eubacteriales bacterium]|nr:chromate transporter [Eubacteriales bacterium]